MYLLALIRIQSKKKSIADRMGARLNFIGCKMCNKKEQKIDRYKTDGVRFFNSCGMRMMSHAGDS